LAIFTIHLPPQKADPMTLPTAEPVFLGEELGCSFLVNQDRRW
jgi:hypothetical protein